MKPSLSRQHKVVKEICKIHTNTTMNSLIGSDPIIRQRLHPHDIFTRREKDCMVLCVHTKPLKSVHRLARVHLNLKHFFFFQTKCSENVPDFVFTRHRQARFCFHLAQFRNRFQVDPVPWLR